MATPAIVASKDVGEVDNDYFLVPVGIRDHGGPLGATFPVENRLLPQGEIRAEGWLGVVEGVGRPLYPPTRRLICPPHPLCPPTAQPRHLLSLSAGNEELREFLTAAKRRPAELRYADFHFLLWLAKQPHLDPLTDVAARRRCSAVAAAASGRWLVEMLGDDDDSHLGDFIEDQTTMAPSDSAVYASLRDATKDVLDTLTPREAKVLRMRFGIEMNTDHTLEEVGKQFDVTRERIRQIEAKALRKLRHPSRSERLRSFLDTEG